MKEWWQTPLLLVVIGLIMILVGTVFFGLEAFTQILDDMFGF